MSSAAKFDWIRRFVRDSSCDGVGNITDDVKCTICRQVMINAHCARCGCRYCLDCVTDYLREEARFCPGITDECNSELMDLRTSVHPDYAVQHKILKLLVKCPVESCHFQGELGKMEEHERVCRKQTINCPYSNVGCQQHQLVTDGVHPHLVQDNEAHARLLMECIGILQNESASTKRDIADLRAEIGELRLEREQQQRVVEQQSGVIEHLNLEMQAVKMDSRAMKERLRSLKEENRTIKNDNDLLYSELEEIRTENQGVAEAVDKRYEEFVTQMRTQANAMEKEFRKCRRSDEEFDQLVGHAENKQGLSWRKGVGEATRTPRMNSEICERATRTPRVNSEICESGEFLWKIDSWASWRNSTRVGKETFSEPFYSHYNGYQICMSTWSEGNYCSVGLHIMRGPFDHMLLWPFRGSINVSIIDQDTGLAYDSYAMTSDNYPNDYRLNKPKKERSNGFSKSWIHLDDLFNNRALCKNGRVFIRCKVAVPGQSCH